MPKFQVFVNPKRPKLSLDKIIDRIEASGFSCSPNDGEIGIVVGGDGTFAYYGRILSIPLLFVGVPDATIVGSKARLAEVRYQNLVTALQEIQAGAYHISNSRMVSISLNAHKTDVLTDVYLERGNLAGCLRYGITVKPPYRYGMMPFVDYAIGNGVIVTTSYGAGGYYSYPDRMRMQTKSREIHYFDDTRIGVCHIIPTFLVSRTVKGLKKAQKVRYTIPYGSTIQIKLLRDAKARLYGTTSDSEGVPVRMGERIIIGPSKRRAKIIVLSKRHQDLGTPISV